MLDRYWSGGTGRISPEAPVPVVKVSESKDIPGGAANVAMNIAALGANATLVSVTGNDEVSKILAQKLQALNVRCEFQKQEGFDTITKLRVMSRHQQLLRLDFEKDFAQVNKFWMLDRYHDLLQDADIVVLSDYGKGCLSDVEQLIEVARDKDIPVIVDPKGANFDKYRGASVITPNMSEFEGVVGVIDDEVMFNHQATQLAQGLSLSALLVTRSEKGMTLIEPEAEQTVLHLPAQAKEIYDVTGAGDTVVAVLAASKGAGADWANACGLANVAASIVVAKLGTSTVSDSELAHALNEDKHDGGVLGEEQLKRVVKQAQGKGETIVMTNGCFDILHAGHVSYLHHAKQLGDRLIVAVNGDESVRRLKGDGRPINNVDRRMLVLNSLASVDWVVRFDEDTPLRLISNILPDTLVKGGDYKVEDIAGGQEVLANGGQVKVLNFEDGVSTTRIIENILQQGDR